MTSPLGGAAAAQTQLHRRIGVFGGAFDPPHRAHLALAEAARDQLRLDLLLVIPTGQAWHRASATSDARHRLAMAQLAFAGLDRVQIDDCEIRRAGPTYTVDTLLELRQRHIGAEWLLVLGADQAQKLSQWERWQELLGLAKLCVAGRDGQAPPADNDDNAARQAKAQGCWQDLRLPAMLVSATEVRRRVAAGEDISGLVPESIARYIAQHYLYQSH